MERKPLQQMPLRSVVLPLSRAFFASRASRRAA
jgi:hypothetical protein